jgi:glycosyltransferase involved in cell wall biosynthesis
MRIGIDARMYGPKATTGIGNYIRNLLENLFLIDQKNEYVIFMKDPAFSQFSPPSKRVEKIKVDFPWYSITEQIMFPKILLKHKLDLVHFPQFNVPIFYPKKFVVTIHDITPKFFPGSNVKKSIIRKIGYQYVFKSAVKKSEKIITVSNFTKNQIIKYFKAPEEKIKVTYLGFDSNFKIVGDQKILNQIKNKYGISKPFLFYVGVWRDHKNLPNLIKAFNLIKDYFKLDIQLVLGGQADDRYPEILEEIKKSKNQADIIRPGFIPEHELPAFYSAAELFVLPSFCEGFGLVAIESLACGTPVAASNTTSVPEIIQDAGLYFNPNESEEIAKCINKALTDKELYEALKSRGFSQIQRYSWQNCAKDTLLIYQSI